MQKKDNLAILRNGTIALIALAEMISIMICIVICCKEVSLIICKFYWFLYETLKMSWSHEGDSLTI